MPHWIFWLPILRTPDVTGHMLVLCQFYSTIHSLQKSMSQLLLFLGNLNQHWNVRPVGCPLQPQSPSSIQQPSFKLQFANILDNTQMRISKRVVGADSVPCLLPPVVNVSGDYVSTPLLFVFIVLYLLTDAGQMINALPFILQLCGLLSLSPRLWASSIPLPVSFFAHFIHLLLSCLTEFIEKKPTKAHLSISVNWIISFVEHRTVYSV